MLSIKALSVAVDEKPILRGIDLEIKPGEVHAIMGPNGSGKSTLSNVLAGQGDYEVSGGQIDWMGQDLLAMAVDERARRGLFMAFQYPVVIPGVSNIQFLKEACNQVRRAQKKPEFDAVEFLDEVKRHLVALDMDESFLYRALNDGFSGGEKKRNEILQLLLLDPQFVILDEIDSGLDIDALQIISKNVENLRDGKRSFLIVTHYPRLLSYIRPDHVHVLAQGKIVRSGGYDLALQLEQDGYQAVLADAAIPRRESA